MIRKTLHAIREMISGLTSTGTFTHNFAITLSGNILAQIIGFLLTPLIARIYGPQAYGLFALFIGLANALAPFATLQLPSGFPMVKDGEAFRRLLKSTISWLLLFVGLSLLFVLWGGRWLSNVLHAPELKPLLFLVPIQLLLMGLDEILLGWSIRQSEFRRSAVGRTVAVVTGKLTTVLLGIFFGAHAAGIIAGNLLQYPLDSLLKASRAMRSELPSVFPLPGPRSLFTVLRKYSSYPAFVATGVALSNLGNQLPIYLLSAFHGGESAGLFAMASSLVLMPLNVVINSSSAVFLQKSSQVLHADPVALGTLTRKLHSRLFWLGALALVGFALVSDIVISWLLGEPWRDAGKFAGIIAAGSLFTASSFTLSVIYRQLNRERINFINQVMFFAFKAIALLLAIRYGDILTAVLAYTAVSVATSFVNLLVIFRLLREDRKELIIQFVFAVVALAGIFMLKIA
jgi:O-antigen/teichoic acid export membrane protein